MDQEETEQISHLAIDIGGSLIKLVYLSRSSGNYVDDGQEKGEDERSSIDSAGVISGSSNAHHSKKGKCAVLEGRLNFTKFETCKINDCLEFIKSKELCLGGFKDCGSPADDKNFIKATGGGALKFGDLFKEKLGISLDRKDEMDCLVKGANFLLKEVQHEAFTYIDGQKEFVQIDHDDLYPYLLVNIGSGVSLIKVTADGEFERVSGTSVGGGTFLGLGRLLTECKGFDELLELSHCGNNRAIDMLVGEIYGGMDYSKSPFQPFPIPGDLNVSLANLFGMIQSLNNRMDAMIAMQPTVAQPVYTQHLVAEQPTGPVAHRINAIFPGNSQQNNLLGATNQHLENTRVRNDPAIGSQQQLVENREPSRQQTPPAIQPRRLNLRQDERLDGRRSRERSPEISRRRHYRRSQPHGFVEKSAESVLRVPRQEHDDDPRHPLTFQIRKHKVSRRIKVPTGVYDGVKDPMTHLNKIKKHVKYQTKKDEDLSNL